MALDLPTLAPEGDEVRIEIEHHMRYRQANTTRILTFDRKAELAFQRTEDGWRLVSLKL